MIIRCIGMYYQKVGDIKVMQKRTVNMGRVKLKYLFARLLSKKPSAIKHSQVDKAAAVGNGALLINSSIGRYSYIYGSNLLHTDLGKFSSVGYGCTIGGGRHPVNWVSSSPVFYSKNNSLKTCFAEKAFDEYVQTTIGNDVWIGSRTMIKGGVTIGDGAIIGMGSIVTKDIPPYEIWAGNPARFIRKRFDEETIEKLQKLQWWNWDEDKLRKYGSFFDDPQKLFEQLEAEK